MEAAIASEMLVTNYQSTQRHRPDGSESWVSIINGIYFTVFLRVRSGAVG
jgi:hypothetical protein